MSFELPEDKLIYLELLSGQVLNGMTDKGEDLADAILALRDELQETGEDLTDIINKGREGCDGGKD